MTENQIGTGVIEAAIAVHREFGPGLLARVDAIISRILQDRPGLQGRSAIPPGAPMTLISPRCIHRSELLSAPQRLCGKNHITRQEQFADQPAPTSNFFSNPFLKASSSNVRLSRSSSSPCGSVFKSSRVSWRNSMSRNRVSS